MVRADFHTHTTFCDGKNTAEEMVLGAMEKGMTAIGFSGHSYVPACLEYCMSREGVRQYREEIARLKDAYGGKIEILCGIEQEFFSPDPPVGYDYVIGSNHNFSHNGEIRDVDASPEQFLQTVEEWFRGDVYAAVENYYESVARIPLKWKVDIIGHIDLVTKFNEGGKLFDENHPRYVAAAKAAIDALLPCGVPFEVNTGAISRGYRATPYPAPWILEYLKEKGARVILSGDAHSVQGLCYQFDKWEPMVRQLGLRLEEHP